MNIEFSLHIGRGSKRSSDASPVWPKGKFVLLAADAIDAQQGRKSLKTIENYKTALRAFARFAGTDMRASQLSAATMEAFAQWLRQRGVSPNTQSCYMRSLRSLIAAMTSRRQAGELFENVFTGNAKTEKRALQPDDMLRLQQLVLPAHSYQAQVRDLFLFCFYAYGLPFADAVRLRWSQVADGTLVYYRRKTGQRICVTLDPLMTDIMLRYRQPSSDLLFPQFAFDSEHDYLQQLNHYNRTLKLLARKAGLSRRLTSYVARHSWASLAYRSSVDLSVISKALGHTNPQTTLIYVKEISDSQLADANKRLLEQFRK